MEILIKMQNKKSNQNPKRINIKQIRKRDYIFCVREGKLTNKVFFVGKILK